MNKNKFSFIKFVFPFIILYFFFIVEACEKHNVKREYEFEERNAIKTIKNPSNPVFKNFELNLEEDLEIKESSKDENYMFYQAADMAIDSEENIYILDSGNQRIQKFDKNGKYILTIGMKGDGPGEFQSPSKLFIDTKDYIYVKDERKIDEFNKEGIFIKSISFNHKTADIPMADIQNFNFIVTPQENIFANIIQYSKSGGFNSLVKLNSEGEIIKEIDKFIDESIKFKGTAEGGAFGGFIHPYNPKLIFSAFIDGKLIYGHSSEYILFVLGKNGRVVLKIIKDEIPSPLSKKEKLKNINMPKNRPFFSKILIDDKERIWICKTKSVLVKSGEMRIDIFSCDGIYLYRVKIPYRPDIIKKGNVYSLIFSEDTGEMNIKRLKIKNWDKMKY
ncbi:MAG: 6-bladed beta-propeller [Candidatus Hodarchaeota archaeon]